MGREKLNGLFEGAAREPDGFRNGGCEVRRAVVIISTTDDQMIGRAARPLAADGAAGKGLPALPGDGGAHGSMGGRAARPLAADGAAGKGLPALL